MSVNESLNRLSTRLTTLKRFLFEENMCSMHPAKATWEGHLTNAQQAAGLLLKELIKSIQPELKMFSVYPTKFEAPEPGVYIDDLLCANDLTELDTENNRAQQGYQEKIEELGWTDKPPLGRSDDLSRQIGAHNMICKEMNNFIKEVISESGLNESAIDLSRARRREAKGLQSPVLNAINNGDEKNLPVPEELRPRRR